MKPRAEYRNVPPFITGPGLHYIHAAPVWHNDGEQRKANRPYKHFFVEDISNGRPSTRITPVTVEEKDGRYHCQPHKIYTHQPLQSYEIPKAIEYIEPNDFNTLPVLLFTGDTLELVGGLETVTFSDTT